MPFSRQVLASAAVAGLCAASGAVKAETLQEAIELAYHTNPTLQAQRAAQRATDEEYVQAKAVLRPNINVSGGYTFTHISENSQSFGGGPLELNNRNASLNLSQTVFTGGAAAAGISAAERDILQGRETLRATEAQIMTQVITAYMDVIRDTEALRINQENMQVLQRQLQETSAEFDVGEVTRTDVSQAEARLAAAQASVSAAEAQLQISRANYAQAVGKPPGDLAPPPTLPGTPSSYDLALDVAQKENPTLRAAQYAEEAARSRVAEARAAYRPNVAINASYQFQYEPNSFQSPNGSGGFVNFPINPYQHTVTAGVQVNIPLYSGGQRGSKVRQALAQSNQAVYGVEGQRRVVLQAVSMDWAQATSAHAQTLADEAQVKAAAVAAEGQRQEAQVGLRTTIDVLNAEEELRNAQLQLVQARHDEYVANAQLLSSMGRLEIRYLDPGLPAYDPKRNFDRVKWNGWTPLDPILDALDAAVAPAGGGGGKATHAPVDSDLQGRGIAKPLPTHP